MPASGWLSYACSPSSFERGCVPRRLGLNSFVHIQSPGCVAGELGVGTSLSGRRGEGMGSYLRPTELGDVLAALARPRAILAGGTDFYPARVGRTMDEDVLDITALPL